MLLLSAPVTPRNFSRWNRITGEDGFWYSGNNSKAGGGTLILGRCSTHEGGGGQQIAQIKGLNAVSIFNASGLIEILTAFDRWAKIYNDRSDWESDIYVLFPSFKWRRKEKRRKGLFSSLENNYQTINTKSRYFCSCEIKGKKNGTRDRRRARREGFSDRIQRMFHCVLRRDTREIDRGRRQISSEVIWFWDGVEKVRGVDYRRNGREATASW